MTPPAPDISILIPTRNRREMLAYTLQSLRAQTLTHWEALVAIDDADTDDTAAFLARASLDDPRIIPVRPAPGHAGAQACRNAAFAHSRAPFLLFLDDDDALSSTALAHRIAALHSNPQLDFVVTACRLFHDTPGDRDTLWSIPDPSRDLERFLALEVPFPIHALLWRRESLQRLMPLPEHLPCWHDWELHLRALFAPMRYEHLPLIDCHYRQSPHANIGKRSRDEQATRAQEQLAAWLHDELCAHALATPERLHLAGGLYWLLVDSWLNLRRRDQAARVWRSARQRGLVTPAQCSLGLAIIATRPLPLVPRLLRRLAYTLWPRGLYFQHSGAFRRLPLDAAPALTLAE